MLNILDASVLGGTASFAFRRGKYTKLRGLVGGKTGTLTGSSPPGLTTWFAGMAPTDQPEVIVASVVMLEGRWIVKGPSLAAEAFWAYFDQDNMEANQISDITSTVAKHVAPKTSTGKTAN
jgi:cell division protein FtsI/penicillin-binding protein 2